MIVLIFQTIILDVHRSNGTAFNSHLGLAPYYAFLRTTEDRAQDMASCVTIVHINIDLCHTTVSLFKTKNFMSPTFCPDNHLSLTAAIHVTSAGVGQHP